MRARKDLSVFQGSLLLLAASEKNIFFPDASNPGRGFPKTSLEYASLVAFGAAGQTSLGENALSSYWRENAHHVPAEQRL